MAKKQPVLTNTVPTRADRLKALLLKALPDMKPQIETGQWGPNGAPYRFGTLPDGRRKLVIENHETEERYGFVGKDHDDLLNQLEQRVSPPAPK